MFLHLTKTKLDLNIEDSAIKGCYRVGSVSTHNKRHVLVTSRYRSISNKSSTKIEENWYCYEGRSYQCRHLSTGQNYETQVRLQLLGVYLQ